MIKEGDVILGGKYEILRHVQASKSDVGIEVGKSGKCRFCGVVGEKNFRKIAHTFPEFIGNKWIFSADECDKCNEIFSLYESSLSSAISSLLTLSGVKGKRNKIRQTGRSGADSVLKRERTAKKSSLSMVVRNSDIAQSMQINPITGDLRLEMPIAPTSFCPRHAYKALTKMAISLLPEEEMSNYSMLVDWLLDLNEDRDFVVLDVGLSFGSILKAPELISGTLLRRIDATEPIPHILFVLAAGSVCFQIDLMSDRLEEHLPPIPMGAININLRSIIKGRDGGEIVISYGNPTHMNWASRLNQPHPIKSIVNNFNIKYNFGAIEVKFRNV